MWANMVRPHFCFATSLRRLRKDVSVGLGFVFEDLLDGEGEDFGDAEGEGERGVVAAGLDGVDALAGDVELLGEEGLGPATEGAEFLEVVIHRRAPDHETRGWPARVPWRARRR